MSAGKRVRCLKCGDIIQSKHRHDLVDCKCGDIFVDGGSEYLRMGWSEGDAKEHFEVLED